jgi:hypothetical protein
VKQFTPLDYLPVNESLFSAIYRHTSRLTLEDYLLETMGMAAVVHSVTTQNQGGASVWSMLRQMAILAVIVVVAVLIYNFVTTFQVRP